VKRHAARELALKALFAYDVGKNEPGMIMELLFEEEIIDTTSKEFSVYLVEGVIENMATIDQMIEKYALEWALDRMPAVDRNIMRVALFEILFSPDIPKAVIINEAIELAKAYGSEDSARFVNGIVGNIIVGNIIKDMPQRK